MFYIALLSWCFKATKVSIMAITLGGYRAGKGMLFAFSQKMTLCKELVPRGFLGELRFASAIHQH